MTTVILQQLASGILNLLAVLGGAIPPGAGRFGVMFNLVIALASGYFGLIWPEVA